MRKGIMLLLATFIFFSYSFTPSYAILIPSADNMTVHANEPDPAKIRAAVNEFMSLPKKEKKSKIRQAKKALKEFKKERKKGNDPSTDTL
jgi:biopolymer transport protein ExbD